MGFSIHIVSGDFEIRLCYTALMGIAEIRNVIANSGPELKAAGIAALYLFGSQGRGDAHEGSDIDLAFDVAEDADTRFSLIDQARIQLRLEKLLDAHVDFVSRAAMRPRMRARVEAEMVRIL
jgi:uncharacterized protein